MTGLGAATRPAAGPSAAPPRAAATRPWPTWALLGAWALLGVGISAREGEWSPWGLGAVVAGFVLVLAVAVLRAPLVAPDRRALAVPLLVAAGAAAIHPVHRLMHVGGAEILAIAALAAATAACALALLLVHHNRVAWLVGAGLAAATGIVTIVAVRDPGIDVWYLLQQSSDGLSHGSDMYRQHWQHSHGLQAVYPYLPLTTVLLAPFRWIFTDVRAGLLTASLLTSLQLRRLAPAAPASLALLVLVHPHWAFLVDQSWTEPLLLALLTAAVLATVRGHRVVGVLALAAALACKQHIVLLLPLFALWPAFGWRRTVAAAVTAGAAILPWVLWDPHQFWHDAVQANLDLGVIPRALCIPSLLLRHGVTVGFWFPLLALALAYLVVVVRVPRTAAGVALGGALVMWTLDLTNKQSFFNHYTLPLGLLVLALTATAAEQPE